MDSKLPSKEELVRRGYSPETIELYDLWRAANAEAQALAARLEEVFGDPPRPRITLHVSRGYDDEWVLSDDRVAKLAALDPEQHWQEVPDEKIVAFQEYFCFADTEGWLFYLPAFFRQCLSEFPLCGWPAIDEACRNRKVLAALTPAQVAFVEEYKSLCRTWNVW